MGFSGDTLSAQVFGILDGPTKPGSKWSVTGHLPPVRSLDWGERERERFTYLYIHLFIYLFNTIIYSFKTTKRVQCKNGMESWTLILAEALDPGSNPLLLMEVRPSSQHAKFLGAFLVLSHNGCGSKRTDCMQHSVVRRHVLSLLRS